MEDARWKVRAVVPRAQCGTCEGRVAQEGRNSAAPFFAQSAESSLVDDGPVFACQAKHVAAGRSGELGKRPL